MQASILALIGSRPASGPIEKSVGELYGGLVTPLMVIAVLCNGPRELRERLGWGALAGRQLGQQPGEGHRARAVRRQGSGRQRGARRTLPPGAGRMRW